MRNTMTLHPVVAVPRARNVDDNTHLDAFVVYFLSNSRTIALDQSRSQVREHEDGRVENLPPYTFYYIPTPATLEQQKPGTD
jgi:hypothetical protein